MRVLSCKTSRLIQGLAASVLLLASHVSQAQTVNLTVAPTSTTLPDGQTVPMWGYHCNDAGSNGATCAAANAAVQAGGSGWSPIVITVPYTGTATSSTTSLTIGLTNNLSFAGGKIPTSLMIVGQLGGGLGSGGTSAASPVHAGQGVTWPTASSATTSTPPAQMPRVQSFGTEVAQGVTATLTWSNLRPGTYLIESGTHHSIQAPMGLYGILVVSATTTGQPQAFPTVPGMPVTSAAVSQYDADLPLVLSEIDPVQNSAVDAAVRAAYFSETEVWSGQPGMCGNPATPVSSTTPACYPPAVNYSPRYYLVNGVSFDRTNITAATAQILAAPAAARTGNVILRLVNAGLRMHVPSVVNLPMTLIAEDGNPLPGQPRIQNEVFMAAGKTYDVEVKPAQANSAYNAATFAFFDRQLSLSTNNQRDGGMQSYIAVAGGATSGVGSPNALSGSGVALSGVVPKTFYCVSGTTLSVTDPANGLLGGSSGANGVALTATGGLAGLTVQSNGTFTYVPPATATCGGTFTYLVNNSQSVTSTIAQCDASTSANPTNGCTVSGAPKLANDSYTGNNARVMSINTPGVLLNDVDPSGRPLTVDPATIVSSGLTSLVVNADGSFTAVAPAAGTYTFNYNVTNSQHTPATSSATVTLTFPAGSGLKLTLVDQKHPADPAWDIADATKKGDYRWIIEEDRTFWLDPKCQVNQAAGTVRPKDSYGRTCPPTPVEALGYNFHTASMPVVATGCVGSVSCESGQTVLNQSAVCDVGDGACRTKDAAGNSYDAITNPGMRTELTPDQVHLDPNKHYFISIMPGDGINPTVNGAGGPMQVDPACDPTATNCKMRQFDPTLDCKTPADFIAGSGACGHNMAGGQIAPQFLPDGTSITPALTVSLIETPLPAAKIAVLVYEDDYPLNGENDAGGGVDILAPNEPGLGGFQVELLDQAGGLGDSTGQITYDMFNMPVSNALAGTPDPMNHMQDACPLSSNPDNLVGRIITCPKYEADGTTLSPLAGQAVIANLYPGLYEPQAFPAADRVNRGEEWIQTNTLDGGKPHEAFIRPGEPSYFQEFGPGGFHVQIGFANPKVINDRRSNAAKNGICDPVASGGGGLDCRYKIYGQVHGNHMSRTPDERTYDTESYDAFSFSSCFVSVGVPDEQDFAFAKCDAEGNYEIDGVPSGTYKMAVFDQWNDIMLDGLITSVSVTGDTQVNPTATQWRTNLYTRTYLDLNGNGIPDRDAQGNDTEPGTVLLPIVIRYRDGSIGFKNNTDLNGYATYNEVFPFMNWLVVEPDQTRYKPTGEHVVYDAGGPDDCTTGAANCSSTASHLAGTQESNSLPLALRVPGAVYCTDADCTQTGESIRNGAYYTGTVDTSTNKSNTAGLSSGRIDPPWHSEGWQGLLGQHSFIDFGMKPFVQAGKGTYANGAYKYAENGGIQGLVVYYSTRPFDDPTLDVQLQWEPGVPNVRINLYKEGIAADGSTTLTLVDTTQTSSWDKWAQGFQTDGHGNLRQLADGSYVPNMNCPGQDPTSGFFATLQGSKMWLDTADSAGNKKKLAYNSQFKCYDGWSQLNQIVPAPYDGKYTFPSTVELDPVTGRPAGTGTLNGAATPLAGTNCAICVPNPDDGTPMLPAGKYVVEAVMPAGFEIVKEEDKNILMGDIYIAPVTQQFAGLGNVFILPDQAAINAFYNANNPLNATTNLGVVNPREDFASTDQMWPCVGKTRIVPDTMSLFPTVGQTAPFAGASRPLCDRKEVSLTDEMGVSARFYAFTKNHIAGHFVGGMTNDMASEFDPFSPQFGEKFGVPNLPIRMRDFTGDEVTRVYGDQWGAYNGLYFSSWEVNPPNPTGYAPQMSVACMNDPGPILDIDPASPTHGQMITDPAYNPAYSNFCYETPFMPGFTAYMDTPVVPTMAFADHYNLPDAEYPDGTPVIKRADFTGNGFGAGGAGPWAPGSAGVAFVHVSNLGNYTAVPTVVFSGGGGTGAAATAFMGVGTVTVKSANGSYTGLAAPTVTFSAPSCTINGTTCVQAKGTATMSQGGQGSTTRRVTGVSLNGNGNTPGSGYTSAPTVSFSAGVATVAATTATDNLGLVAVNVTASGNGYTGFPTVSFTGGGGGATANALLTGPITSLPLVLTAYGDRPVQNPQYTGPSGTTAPYNTKTVTRHYGFGARCTAISGACSAVSSVTVGGLPATITGWSDTSITVTVPGLPLCALQQRSLVTNVASPAPASCGQVVITAGNGKQSIDGITVTVGGTASYVSTASPISTKWGEIDKNPLQTAIDSAKPGDLIIVEAGSYRENVIMWKPVRLQGVGAGSVVINGDAQPAGKMDSWRRRVSCLFGLTIQGVPNTGNAAYDPDNQYTCPADQYFRSDRLPFEGFIGWDASSNGNLAQVMQEPSLMGAYEGAGITVLGRGVNQRGSNNSDLWGVGGGAGTYPDGSRYVSVNDCQPPATRGNAATNNINDYATSNFLCNPSAIDGVSIINSSQGGGGIYLHGWNHNMQIANTRISANAGTLSGAINLGNGETPPAFVLDNTICGNTGAIPAPLCPPNVPNAQLQNVQQTQLNGVIPFQMNTNVHIHNNQIIDNASIGDALFSGSPAGAGGVTVSAGSDNYEIDHNWIAANLTSSDGGGIAQMGLSFNGKIHNNFVLFNQANNPTLPVDGGGIVIMGAQEDRTLPNGQECGGTTDLDCPPGIGDGTGPGLVIDSNLILGNSAEDGSGGGLRLRQTNGSEVAAFLQSPNSWYGITVTNNIIANNVAGWDGGGVSLQDSFKTVFTNNTVVSNDTTASAGVLFKTLGAVSSASPPPGCLPTPDPTQPQSAGCLDTNGPHIPQPAGLVTMQNTPNMMAQLPNGVVCPAGFGYGDANDSASSRRNGRCVLVSLPQMTNDMFWQNRAFHVEIVDSNGTPIASGNSATPTGTGLKSHQNIVALLPEFKQTGTGQCTPPPAGQELYWDLGVRMDGLPTQGGHLLTFNQATVGNGTYNPANGGSGATANGADVGPVGLSASYSIFSDTLNAANLMTAATAPASVGNQVPTTSPVIAQYCNGARIPPEQCTLGQGANDPAMCLGFFAPAGQSETVGVSPVFQFSNIAATATVDEGNNWINLSFGPLTLGRPSATAATATELMVATADQGAVFGAYSIAGTSTAAVNQGTNNGAPRTDFFGHTRPLTANNKADIGAVEFQPPNFAVVAVTPTSLTFTGVLTSTTSAAQTLTVSNTGGVDMTGLTLTFSSPQFTRATGAAGGTCPATAIVAASSSCTIGVVFAPGTSTTTVTGTVAITGSVTVTGAPVALSGTGSAATHLAAVSPGTLAFGNWASGTTSNAQTLTVTNTGNSALTGGTFVLAFGGGTPQPFSRPNGNAGGTCNGALAVAPGASCTINVVFAPGAATPYSRTLTVTYPGATVTGSLVTLTGTGIGTRATATVAPNPLTITLPTGVLSVTGTGTVTLTNTAPANGAQLLIANVTTTGGNLATYFFNVVGGGDTCSGTVLAPAASCTVNVRFTNTGSPRGTNRAGTINFSASGGGAAIQGALVGFATL
jgi:hypothetical protein